MAEAARFARKRLIQKGPRAHLSRFLVVRGMARALSARAGSWLGVFFSRARCAESISSWTLTRAP
eukprot:5326874-Pyramimonas_sp.AAC.1